MINDDKWWVSNLDKFERGMRGIGERNNEGKKWQWSKFRKWEELIGIKKMTKEKHEK